MVEFDNVIVVGATEGDLPHSAAVKEGPGAVEEERRLMYVAMTRAKNTLTILWPGRKFARGQHVECKPSRFIAEMSECSAQKKDK